MGGLSQHHRPGINPDGFCHLAGFLATSGLEETSSLGSSTMRSCEYSPSLHTMDWIDSSSFFDRTFHFSAPCFDKKAPSIRYRGYRNRLANHCWDSWPGTSDRP